MAIDYKKLIEVKKWQLKFKNLKFKIVEITKIMLKEVGSY